MNVLTGHIFGMGLVLASACTQLQVDVSTPDIQPQEADEEAVLARVILVGDAGRPDPLVLRTVHAWSKMAPDRTTVVFLGDNVYENGLPDGPALREKAVLDKQIEAVGSRNGLFVPGNHDWRSGRMGIKRQAAHVERNGPSMRFLPSQGCPGPAPDDSLSGILIVAVDTEWLLQTSPDVSGCDLGARPLATFAKKVEETLDAAGESLVIVVAHHPPRTYGPHGGYYTWQDHLFPLTRLKSWAWVPLPVVGSIFPLVRKLVADEQDTFSDEYQAAQARLAEAFSVYRGPAPLIFAGGHDHSLQVLSGTDPWDYILVSGTGSSGKLTHVSRGPDTIFAVLVHGFMTVDLYPDRRVLLRVIESGNNSAMFARWLTLE